RLGTIAAGLCAAVLVGALLLVLNLARQHNTNSSGVAQTSQQIIVFVSLHMIDASNGWALSSKAFLHTTDGGVHWQDVTPRGVRLTPGSLMSTSVTADQAWFAVP